MDKSNNTGPLDLLVRGGALVIPGVGQVKADVGIAGGKIVALGESLTQPAARYSPASSIRTPISATSSPTTARPRPRPALPSSAA
jgi:urease alpha subunit